MDRLHTCTMWLNCKNVQLLSIIARSRDAPQKKTERPYIIQTVTVCVSFPIHICYRTAKKTFINGIVIQLYLEKKNQCI